MTTQLFPIPGAVLPDEPTQADALVVVTGDPTALSGHPWVEAWRRHCAVDAQAIRGVCLLACDQAPGGRLIISPTGPLLRDHDDVRAIGEAAGAGVKRAAEAGARQPALLLHGVPNQRRYDHALQVALLGAQEAVWQPLEARESLGHDVVEPVHGISLQQHAAADDRLGRWVQAVEAGRRLARDLAGTQPERMTPIRFAEYVELALSGTGVDVEIVDDLDVLETEYPLLMSVARASKPVPRHHPRVVRLSWQGEGPIRRTALFSGKGVTYDTGGADLKTDGHMAGMSRDKGGAAAVAGLFKTAALLKPAGVALRAELGLVRNDIGPDSFVADEIIVSHAGVRVRIGNTDAEGRLVMADMLSHLRRKAAQETHPHLFTVATLTGHAGVAMGPYTIAMDNGPACGTAEALARAGDALGEPVEVSRLRREDWAFVAPRTKADDVLSCNNLPSSRTPRGHQFPMAFLATAAGLDKHGQDSEHPLPYTHIDIGGSGVRGGDWQHGSPSGTPLVALTGAILEQMD